VQPIPKLSRNEGCAYSFVGISSPIMASEDLSSSNFGLIIAYIIPGFTALHGIPGYAANPTALTVAGNEQSIAGFLSITIDALFIGLTLSAARWLVIDSIHNRTGIRPPKWDFSALEKATDAYTLLIKNHYQYYKFYANMMLALLLAYASGGYSAHSGVSFPDSASHR
jgi:hypothetical protein